MPIASQSDKIKRIKKISCTGSISNFELMCKHNVRPNIVAEGDSWFAYPKKYIVAGRSANIIDHIERWTKGKANLLRLAANGDEATGMLSSGQRHRICKVLSRASEKGRPVDLLLFSGGGNDLVGAWDLPRFLREYKSSYSAEQCLNSTALKNKIQQVAMAHVELMNVRNYYSPDTVIITHTYDRVFPSLKGARFFGLKLSKSWLKPHMDDKGIPPSLQNDIATLIMERLRVALLRLPSHASAHGKFHVVDTMGTLNRKHQWLNEIHPTSAGFSKIAKKIYRKARSVDSRLPAAPA